MDVFEAKKLIETGNIYSGKTHEIFGFGFTIIDDCLGKIFIPRSLSGVLGDDTDLSILFGRNILFKLLDYNDQRNCFIAASQAVVNEKISSLEPFDFDNLHIGNTYYGIVEYVGKYGVFINLGGMVGFAPTYDSLNSQSVAAGSSVSVVIGNIDTEKKRITLTKCTE